MTGMLIVELVVGPAGAWGSRGCRSRRPTGFPSSLLLFPDRAVDIIR